MIAWWPGKIKAKSTSNLISAFWDVMPTLAELAGIKTPENIDGISFLSTLLGKEDQKKHESMYWEFHELGGRQAIRKGNLKLVRYQVLDSSKTTTELYDLSADIAEKNNIAKQYPEIVADLIKLLAQSRTQSDVFNFQSPTIIK
jgi:arylsulfatase A